MSYESKLKTGARPLLDPGEEVQAAFVARPRGWTQATAGSMHLGASQQGRAYAAGEGSGLRLASPMALAVTQRRLLVLGIGSPIGLGIGGRVKALVSAVPIAQVESITVKRLALGKVVTVTIGGEEIKLEANAAAGAQGVVDAFEHARAQVTS